ncbi:hypothetical protein QX220_06205 [Vibrio vulnificus]|uniref:hypothetical protein n=1 Tax=Vibrio vulnificus TaxID=672 RepID=UPI000C79D885|nr:hypothetical protein [Vibrio vulnificus]AUJ37444.1 hypothetical protein BWZ32_21780 [Vibrio vulnificus]MDS1861232.1 hypothetical protein [Vibrio vulnificus]HCG9749820.1 hypothetical protein [Vibrio parahaemolyticus]
MNKAEQNKAHYEKNKVVLKEKARARRATQKKLKTFGELMEELSTSTQKAKAQFIIDNTPTELLQQPQARKAVAAGFESMTQHLTESETLQIRKNKRLVQRWHMFLKALEQHLNDVIDKRVAK